MPAVVTKWPDSRRPEVEAALRESSTVREAAERMGITEPTLRGAFKSWRLDYHALLKRAAPVVPPPPPGGVLVQGNGPELEQGSSEDKSTCEPLNMDWSGARPQSSGVGLERRVILGDLHIPFHDLRACAAALAVIRAVQPHRIIQLGDYFNMGAVSHHPRPFGGPENHDRSLRMGIAFAEAMRKAAPGAEILILAGNHDAWADEYEDANPQFAGLMAARHLGLERLGIRWVPRSAQPLVVGPVGYTHGYGGGEHYAKRYVIDVAPAVGVKYLKVAHHHSVQRFHGKNGAECWGVGWLGNPVHSAFDYAKNRDHWEAALVIEDVIGERVTTTPVRLDGGAALYGGRLVAA